MAGHAHVSESSFPDKQALSSLLKYLKKQNLKETEGALRKELGIPEADLDRLVSGSSLFSQSVSEADPAAYDECYASSPSSSPSGTKTEIQSAKVTSPSSTNLAHQKRCFSWPGSLPSNKTTSIGPTVFQFAPPQQSTAASIQNFVSDEASLKANCTSSSNGAPLWVNTLNALSTVPKQPLLTNIPTAVGSATQFPFGTTPLVYHVAPVQNFGLQRSVVTPLFTVLPSSSLQRVAPVISPPVTKFNQSLPVNNDGSLLQFQGKDVETVECVEPEEKAVLKEANIDDSIVPEPSTGQIHTPLLSLPTHCTSFSDTLPKSSDPASMMRALKQPAVLASIPPDEMTPAYYELKAFAEEFKTRRIKLGFTQGAVGQSLADKGYSNFAQSTISRFEQMQLSPTNAAAIKQVLEKWIEDAENPNSSPSTTEFPQSINCRKRKKRAVFTTQTRNGLEEFFSYNPRPNRQDIESVAQELSLLPEEVRVWFCNKRQKQKQQSLHHVTQQACQESTCTSTSGNIDPPSPLKRKTPSPPTGFSIEELSKSSTSSVGSCSSASPSPVPSTSPFRFPQLPCTSMFAVTPTCTN